MSFRLLNVLLGLKPKYYILNYVCSKKSSILSHSIFPVLADDKKYLFKSRNTETTTMARPNIFFCSDLIKIKILIDNSFC